MAKYYTQTGEFQMIVDAADAEGAALWLINQAVLAPENDQHVELNDRSAPSLFIEAFVFAADQLDEDVSVSEIGFGRDESGSFPTESLLKQWFDLHRAMNHLLDQLKD